MHSTGCFAEAVSLQLVVGHLGVGSSMRGGRIGERLAKDLAAASKPSLGTTTQRDDYISPSSLRDTAGLGLEPTQHSGRGAVSDGGFVRPTNYSLPQYMMDGLGSVSWPRQLSISGVDADHASIGLSCKRNSSWRMGRAVGMGLIIISVRAFLCPRFPSVASSVISHVACLLRIASAPSSERGTGTIAASTAWFG